MKKFFLSSFVVITFIAYALYQRLSNTDTTQPLSPVTTTNTSQPSNTIAPIQQASGNPPTNSGFKDGQFTGDVVDAFYGNVQVKATIQGGKITSVQFLDYPQDRRTSQMINSQAMPALISETIQAQSANVDIVSGATQTSLAFRQSLSSALSKAK